MISYDKLWITLKEKKITQYMLIKEYNFSRGQLSRLKKNCYVNTHTLDVLCSILNCNIEDICEYKPNN